MKSVNFSLFSVFFAIIMIASMSLLPLFGNNAAFAKLIPSSRPDIAVEVLMIPEEVQLEDDSMDPKWDYIIEQTYDRTGNDLSNLKKVFELVAISAVDDFFETHKSELAGKYVDTLFVRYRPNSNELFISVWYSTSVYETVTARSLPDQYTLSFIDEVSFKIPLLKQLPSSEDHQLWVDYNILEYHLPAASARISFLSDKMQELYLQNRDKLLKSDTTVSLPEKEPVILKRISAVMFEEMSKIEIRYMDRPIGLYNGMITKYDTQYLHQQQDKELTSEHLEECEKLRIEGNDCADVDFRNVRMEQHVSRSRVDSGNDAINFLSIIGIGAAGAAVAAIVTLKRSKSLHKD